MVHIVSIRYLLTVCQGGWIEINSRALKKKLPSPYPLPDILEVRSVLTVCVLTHLSFA